MNFLPLGPIIGLIGLVIFFMGIGLWELFNTTQKIHRRGLNRPLNFREQIIVFFSYPDISIPTTFIYHGGLMIIVSVVMTIIGIIQKFLI